MAVGADRGAPHLIVSFKRQVYLDLLAEFGGLSRLSVLMADPIVKFVIAWT